MSEIDHLRGSLAMEAEMVLNALENTVQAIASSDPSVGTVLLDTLKRSEEESEP